MMSTYRRGRPSTSATIVGALLAILIVGVLVLAGLAVAALIFQWAFNLLAPAFGLSFIDFWPAFGVVTLIYLIARLFRGSGK